jgi:hypothetical protein
VQMVLKVTEAVRPLRLQRMIVVLVVLAVQLAG